MRKEHFNFKILNDLVGTKYGDLTGLIQADGHNNVTELYDLCAKHGISRDEYFLIGFGLSDFTIQSIGQDGGIDCTVLLLEKDKYAKSFDEIKEIIKDASKVDVIKRRFRVNYKDLGRYIKRIDALMLTEMGNYIKEINIIDEED